jgi:hypothetical protein
MTIDWSRSLVGQLTFYWDFHLWPRLAGLTDEEYFWEPAGGCWSLRPTGDGGWRMDRTRPAGQPEPLTTIAWRMTHLAVECFESRVRAFFGGEGPTMFSPGERILTAGDLPGTAADGLAYLERAYRHWRDGVAGLGEAGLLGPLGPAGADYAEEPMAELVLHLNREAMHHGGEICLLRDLYRATGASDRADRLVPRRPPALI